MTVGRRERGRRSESDRCCGERRGVGGGGELKIRDEAVGPLAGGTKGVRTSIGRAEFGGFRRVRQRKYSQWASKTKVDMCHCQHCTSPLIF